GDPAGERLAADAVLDRRSDVVAPLGDAGGDDRSRAHVLADARGDLWIEEVASTDAELCEHRVVACPFDDRHRGFDESGHQRILEILRRARKVANAAEALWTRATRGIREDEGNGAVLPQVDGGRAGREHGSLGGDVAADPAEEER